MLAKLTRSLPEGEGFFYEPKWDGFRCIVFRDGESVVLGSRNEKPLNRYFPELIESLLANVPDRCVLDGEIVIAGPNGLDFDALSQRIHPAASRVKLLAQQSPASFVAFDLLALEKRTSRGSPMPSDGPRSRRRWRRHDHRSMSPRSPPSRTRPATGSPDSKGPGWTGSSPNRARCTTSRANG